MPEIIYLSNVRLSFPQLVEARASVAPSPENPNPKKKFSADFLMAPDNPAVLQFRNACQKEAVEKWKENANAITQLIMTDRRLRCFGNGDEKVNQKTFQVYDGYPGMFYISASSSNTPQMIQTDGVPVDPANTMAYQALARKMYGGCYVNAAVKPWLQENKHGRAIRCELVAVQFFADGEAFGEAAVDASPMFGAVGAPATGLPSFLG